MRRRHLGSSQHLPPSVPKPTRSHIWDQGFELGALFVVGGLVTPRAQPQPGQGSSRPLPAEETDGDPTCG